LIGRFRAPSASLWRSLAPTDDPGHDLQRAPRVAGLFIDCPLSGSAESAEKTA
jgi:hypothetical protein